MTDFHETWYVDSGRHRHHLRGVSSPNAHIKGSYFDLEIELNVRNTFVMSRNKHVSKNSLCFPPKSSKTKEKLYEFKSTYFEPQLD